MSQEHSSVQRRIQHCWGRSQLKPKLWDRIQKSEISDPEIWNLGSRNLKSWIQKSEILDPEIWNLAARNLKSWIQKSKILDPEIWNLAARNPASGPNLIQRKIVKLIIDKYSSSSTALPPTVIKKNLIINCSGKKYLPMPKTEHSTQWEQKYLWIVISRIVNSGLW